jgi:lipoprotein LpqB-like beta-propeller protein/sporulation and spore germination protein
MSRRAVVALLSLAGLLLSGCGVSMPTSGPVQQTTAGSTPSDDEAVTINPRGPGKDDTPEEVVRGFVEAMTATPAITTSIAREFLTRDARATWQPTGTIIYSGALSTSRGSSGSNGSDGNIESTVVEAHLSDAAATDARGAWLGDLPDEQATLPITMTTEDGQWRISDPPDWLIVPQRWFEQRFRQVSLYFFDPTGTILIPEPVFVPLGQQFASTLVNGLLTGPSPELADNELTLVPGDLRSLSVPVSDGVANVELTSDTAAADVMPAPAEAELLVSQLAWTLGQDPAIQRFGVTIGGRPVQLADGSTEFGIDHGHEYAPYVAGSSTLLFGLLEGKLVGGSPQNLEPVAGPFGRPDYGLRVAVPDLRLDLAAGVTASGTTLVVGPVKETGEAVTSPITDGEDLLDPAWDFSGRVWEVDRRAGGSVVEYVQNGKAHVLDVPGITGQDVKHFLVSRDGSRLVAVLRTDGLDDAIVVSRILTGGDGSVDRALPAVTVTAPEDLDGQVRDIAWLSPTSITVLRPVSRSFFQVRPVTVDGAPNGVDISIPIDREVAGLVGTPVPDESGYAFVPGVPASGIFGALVDLAGPRSNATEIDARVTSLGYVG